jgi:hypothetical protein
MKWLAIMNPHAGFRIRESLEELEEDLKRNIGADCLWTNSHGATEVVLANRRYNGFIAVGGDGTICEVINGLDPKIHALRFIPAEPATVWPEPAFQERPFITILSPYCACETKKQITEFYLA